MFTLLFIYPDRCFLNFFAFLLFTTCYVGFSLAEPQCDLVNRTIPGLDKICGYEYTAKFDFDNHFTSASRAVTSLRSILGNCSQTVETMICSLFVPRCTEEIRGPYLPCRAVCDDYATKCQDIIVNKGLEWTVAMCNVLPEKDNPDTTKGYRERCFTPPNFKDSGKSKLTVHFVLNTTGLMTFDAFQFSLRSGVIIASACNVLANTFYRQSSFI